MANAHLRVSSGSGGILRRQTIKVAASGGAGYDY